MRDVVGVENAGQEVYMLCNKEDGSNEDVYRDFADSKELAKHLNGLSQHARFLRFAADYLNERRAKGLRGPETQVNYRVELVGGQEYVVLRLKDAIEFMTKKDYADNWKSELNEEFAFWSISNWKRELRDAGFDVVVNPAEPRKGSRVYRNNWIVENKWNGKVALFTKAADGALSQMEYPVTTMVLVGEKR